MGDRAWARWGMPSAVSGLAVLVTAFGVGCLANRPPPPEWPGPPWETEEEAAARRTTMDDEQISTHIRTELFRDPIVPDEDIEVSVDDGIATLTGQVENLLAEARAARLAEVVRGVRSVSNRIDVGVPARKDLEIHADVRAALLANPATRSSGIEPRVKDQVVTLQGSVASYHEKMLAERVARGVRGVRDVHDDIDLEIDDSRSDAEIHEDVRQALRWDALVDEEHIDVAVDGGIVVLSGRVGSLAEARRAAWLSWTSGVRSVDVSPLGVDFRLTDTYKHSSVMVEVDDAEIARALRSAFQRDPRLSAASIEPRVVRGNVVLRGNVDNMQAKHVASRIARHTYGVVSVTNEMSVEPGTEIADAKIAEQIGQALRRNPVTEDEDVEVTVTNGIATLSGEVDTHAEKAEAEDLAAGVEGVVAMRNSIEVPDSAVALVEEPYLYPYYPHVMSWSAFAPERPQSSDETIAERIREELYFSPFVDGNDVSIAVERGRATLSGSVGSARARRTAVTSAFEGGAVAVNDRLRVEP